jgi:hypothetical protein
MSRDDVEIAGANRVAPAQRRIWEDRVAVRLPGAYRRVLALLWPLFGALRPGHPLRRFIAERWISRLNGAFNRSDIDLLSVLFHPELVWDWSRFEGWPEEPVTRGVEGLRRGFTAWREAWGELTFDSSEYRDFGEKHMLTARMRAAGFGSGIAIERTFWQVAAVRDGLLAWVANYTDRQEALDAAQRGK